MKKHLLLLLGALLALPSLARDFQYTYEGQTITYTVIDEEAKTCMAKEGSSQSNPGNNISGTLILPSTPKDGYTKFSLIKIGGGAFASCSGLTSVSVPNSVTEIGGSAFYRCNGLTSVIISESVTNIGYLAFYGCSSLTKAEFSSIEQLCSIDFVSHLSNPLYYAHNLYINGEEVTNVVIPESVTKIGNYAFQECSSLTSVNIPNSVTGIGEDAFSGCSSLTSVNIPNSVTEIGRSAFSRCSSLTSVSIPNSVTSIGESTFERCSGLTSVTIGNSVTEIGEDAFAECTSMTSLTIGNSVTEIGEYAFTECSGLTSITIPNSVTKICHMAFYACSGITSVTIPNSVTEMSSPFGGCENLSSINVDPNNTSFTSVNGVLYSKDMSIIVQFPAGKKQQVFTIPNSVTEIGERAFLLCTNLTSITIPNSITKNLDEDTFAGCSGLTSVTYLAENPVGGYWPFDKGTYQKATLNYLKSAEEKIASTDPWSRFVNRIGRDADYKEEGAISEVQSTNGGATAVYDMRGVKVGESTEGLPKGIYIIRQGSKTTKHAI